MACPDLQVNPGQSIGSGRSQDLCKYIRQGIIQQDSRQQRSQECILSLEQFVCYHQHGNTWQTFIA